MSNSTPPPNADEQHAASQGSLVIQEWRRAWKPGLAAMLVGAVGYSVWSSVSSLLIKPLQAAFGWSRGEISFAYSFGIAAAFLSPLVGQLVDLLGVRRVLLVGLTAITLCYAAFALMNGSLPLFYAIYLVFVTFGLASTGISYTRVIVGAFQKTRGTALAISRGGLTLSAALLPALLFVTISRWGHAGGYLTLASLIVLIALPLTWFWIPGRDPAKPGQARTGSALVERWRMLAKQPKILLLSLAAALNYAPVVALLSQMAPLAESKGMPPQLAVASVSTVGLAALAGALLTGVLVDRFWAPLIGFFLNLMSALGCVLLLPHAPAPWALFTAVALIGLAQGVEIDLVAFMTARYFGLRNYGAIYGISVLVIGVTTNIAAVAIGRMYDRFGDYNVPLTIAGVSFALAACLYLLMGRYPKTNPDAEPAA